MYSKEFPMFHSLPFLEMRQLGILWSVLLHGCHGNGNRHDHFNSSFLKYLQVLQLCLISLPSSNKK